MHPNVPCSKNQCLQLCLHWFLQIRSCIYCWNKHCFLYFKKVLTFENCSNKPARSLLMSMWVECFQEQENTATVLDWGHSIEKTMHIFVAHSVWELLIFINIFYLFKKLFYLWKWYLSSVAIFSIQSSKFNAQN